MHSLSPLRPEFDPRDGQWLYMTGHGGRPLGHLGFFSGTPASSHSNDPLLLTAVPTRDNMLYNEKIWRILILAQGQVLKHWSKQVLVHKLF